MNVSAASTTNFRNHLQSAQKVLVIKELKADETLEVGQHSTLQTLKQDYASVEKFHGTFKLLLDGQFCEVVL